jgi:hypothetical protein
VPAVIPANGVFRRWRQTPADVRRNWPHLLFESRRKMAVARELPFEAWRQPLVPVIIAIAIAVMTIVPSIVTIMIAVVIMAVFGLQSSERQ